MIGRRLGHYEIAEKIGEGGMGQVFRARDTTLGRDVALKLLTGIATGDPERVARLEREARLLASLNHPHIATLHGLEESEGLKYLVMELVPGDTLADRIARGPMRVEECLGIFGQIAEALEAAHEKGIIHRDLKPANVAVSSEGHVKVLDFGLAKSVLEPLPSGEPSNSPTLTREGTEQGVILGTASYMSPEQARGKRLDRRTDIWSFGCVLYEALTGQKAFPGETVSDVVAAILEKEPDWSALPARVPPPVRRLLRRCLQKDAYQRMRDIGDARIEIREAPGESSAASAAMPARRYWPWAVVALVSAVTLWSSLRRGAEPERGVFRLTVSLPPEQGLSWVNAPSVAISPDGRQLVYVGGAGSERRLYVRPIDQLEPRSIPGTEGATTAFFSPGGDWVGFFGRDSKLKKVRPGSGIPVVVCDAPDPWGASWGTDEEIVFVPGTGSGLWRVSSSGGSPAQVTTPDPKQGETAHIEPEVLPDGNTVLFTILTSEGVPRIGILSLKTGEHRALVQDGFFARYAPTGHLLYMQGDTLLAVPFDTADLALTGDPFPVLEGVWANPGATGHYAFSSAGTLVYVAGSQWAGTLVRVDRTGATRSMSDAHRAYEDPRFSPDGRMIAVTIRNQGLHLWVYDLSRDAFMQITFGREDDQAPVWTPDGKRLAFRRGLASNMFWMPADGSGPEERLTTSDYLQRPNSFSPDGRLLIYSEIKPKTQGDLWLLELAGERRAQPYLETPSWEDTGILSPDGRFLAYTSNESGASEVYVRPFPGPGGKWKISDGGGIQPVWARSGREIFYRIGEKMMAVVVERDPFRPGNPVLLFEGQFSDPDYGFPQYDVAPDGQSFVMIRREPMSQIHVVLNWFEELQRRVPPPPR